MKPNQNLTKRIRERRDAKARTTTNNPMSNLTSKIGIKETADLITFIAIATTAAFNASKDGFSLADAGIAFSLLDEAKDAFVGMKEIPAELSDLEEGEIAAIVKIVAEKLILPPSKATEIVPFVLRMVPLIFGVIACINDDDDEPKLALDDPALRFDA